VGFQLGYDKVGLVVSVAMYDNAEGGQLPEKRHAQQPSHTGNLWRTGVPLPHLTKGTLSASGQRCLALRQGARKGGGVVNENYGRHWGLKL